MQSSSQEGLCGSDRADGHHVHQQPGQAQAGPHQCCPGAHQRLQDCPAQEICQGGFFFLWVILNTAVSFFFIWFFFLHV